MMLHTRVSCGVEWIWYLDAQGEGRQVKRTFTDLAKGIWWPLLALSSA